MAEFTTLYSGSSGNCGVVRYGSKYLLIDMGKSCRITETALKKMGFTGMPEALLITHEHADHISGVKVYLKKAPFLPVAARQDTLENMVEQGLLPVDTKTVPMEGQAEQFGPFTVTSFYTSHDVPCCGYRIRTPDGSVMAIATDLGELTPSVHKALSGCNLVALESNYDEKMLRYGPYPYYLKQRIASRYGHLSNGECAAKVLELVQEGCAKFALCHMSKDNNTIETVMTRITSTLLMAGERLPEGGCLQVMKRNEPSDWMEY